MKQRWGLIALVAIISFFTGGWLLQQGSSRDGNVYQQARLFDDVLSHVSAYYVDSIPQTELYQKATEGLLAELKDPRARTTIPPAGTVTGTAKASDAPGGPVNSTRVSSPDVPMSST